MRQATRRLLAAALIVSGALAAVPAGAAGGAHGTAPDPGVSDNLTPQERMARRFPQPVKVGDLVGWPLLDLQDRVLGYVREVVRTPTGIVLVVPVGGWFGYGARPVGVPIEAVALIGAHVALLDIPAADLPAQPTWTGQGATPIAASETIRMAITRR